MKHTREYRNSGKTRTPVELSKRFLLVRYRQRQRKLFFFFFLTDNSTPTVTNRAAQTWKHRKFRGEEVKGGKKRKITCSKKQQTRGKLEKRQAFATVIVGFTFSFWRRQHQCLTMETAGRLCVPPELLWGFLIEKASVRAFWLQSCPAERSPHCTDNLTFLRPRSSAAALPFPLKTLQSCCAGALCGLRSTKTHLSVNPCFKTHTGHRKHSPCPIWVMIWISECGGMKQFQESVCWMKAWRPFRINNSPYW